MKKILQDRLGMATLMVEDYISAAHDDAEALKALRLIHRSLSYLAVRGNGSTVDPSLLNVFSGSRNAIRED